MLQSSSIENAVRKSLWQNSPNRFNYGLDSRDLAKVVSLEIDSPLVHEDIPDLELLQNLRTLILKEGLAEPKVLERLSSSLVSNRITALMIHSWEFDNYDSFKGFTSVTEINLKIRSFRPSAKPIALSCNFSLAFSSEPIPDPLDLRNFENSQITHLHLPLGANAGNIFLPDCQTALWLGVHGSTPPSDFERDRFPVFDLDKIAHTSSLQNLYLRFARIPTSKQTWKSVTLLDIADVATSFESLLKAFPETEELVLNSYFDQSNAAENISKLKKLRNLNIQGLADFDEQIPIELIQKGYSGTINCTKPGKIEQGYSATIKCTKPGKGDYVMLRFNTSTMAWEEFRSTYW